MKDLIPVVITFVMGAFILAVGIAGGMLLQEYRQPWEPTGYNPKVITVEIPKVVELVETVEVEVIKTVEIAAPMQAPAQPYPAPVTPTPQPEPTQVACTNYPLVLSRTDDIIQGSAIKPGKQIYRAKIKLENRGMPDACTWDSYYLMFVGDPMVVPVPVEVPLTLPGEQVEVIVWEDVVYENLFLEVYLTDDNGNYIPMSGSVGLVTSDGTVTFQVDVISPQFEGIPGGRYGGFLECGPRG
jgi:hypothetical protein